MIDVDPQVVDFLNHQCCLIMRLNLFTLIESD
jgi:hypothetical protein